MPVQYTVYSPVNGTVVALGCYCSNRVCGTNINYPGCSSSAPCNSNCIYGSCTNDSNACTCQDWCARENIACSRCSSPGKLPCECSACCKHYILEEWLNYAYPADINCAPGGWVRFYGSSNIGSIRARQTTGVCGNQTGAINEGVKVEVYGGSNAASGYIGTLHYAHLANRIAHHTIINRPSGGWQSNPPALGTTPTPVPPNQRCYMSHHVHLQIFGTGMGRSNLSCQTGVNTSTAIYWWTV